MLEKNTKAGRKRREARAQRGIRGNRRIQEKEQENQCGVEVYKKSRDTITYVLPFLPHPSLKREKGIQVNLLQPRKDYSNDHLTVTCVSIVI